MHGSHEGYIIFDGSPPPPCGFVVQGGAISKARLDDSDDEMAGPDPYSGEVVLGEGNEAYRVYDDPAAVPAAEGAAEMYNGNGARCATPGTANLPCLAWLIGPRSKVLKDRDAKHPLHYFGVEQ